MHVTFNGALRANAWQSIREWLPYVLPALSNLILLLVGLLLCFEGVLDMIRRSRSIRIVGGLFCLLAAFVGFVFDVTERKSGDEYMAQVNEHTAQTLDDTNQVLSRMRLLMPELTDLNARVAGLQIRIEAARGNPVLIAALQRETALLQRQADGILRDAVPVRRPTDRELEENSQLVEQAENISAEFGDAWDTRQARETEALHTVDGIPGQTFSKPLPKDEQARREAAASQLRESAYQQYLTAIESLSEQSEGLQRMIQIRLPPTVIDDEFLHWRDEFSRARLGQISGFDIRGAGQYLVKYARELPLNALRIMATSDPDQMRKENQLLLVQAHELDQRLSDAFSRSQPVFSYMFADTHPNDVEKARAEAQKRYESELPPLLAEAKFLREQILQQLGTETAEDKKWDDILKQEPVAQIPSTALGDYLDRTAARLPH